MNVQPEITLYEKCRIGLRYNVRIGRKLVGEVFEDYHGKRRFRFGQAQTGSGIHVPNACETMASIRQRVAAQYARREAAAAL